MLAVQSLTQSLELFDKGGMVWSFFPSFTGWGTIVMLLNYFSNIIDKSLNETTDAIQLLTEEIRERHKLVLQEKNGT